MLSPLTVSIKLSQFPTKSSGIGNVSVTFSTAKIGSPAVIFPITGTSTISLPVYRFLGSAFLFLSFPSSPFSNLNVLPFCSSFLIYPFCSSLDKYPCTVAVDFRSTASPISLTDGG